MSEARIVSRGAIRVDARRAVVKLREHLLVDLNAYALELARAAVASGAKHLDVRYDSDDVIFAFDGAKIPEAKLPQLLSYVLAETEDLREQPVRLLALGVNAALGLGPSFVDVMRRDGSRTARVRWTPELLVRDDAALPVVQAVSPPPGSPKHGTIVHLRRKLGSAVLVNAITGRIPPEIQLLAEHTHEASLGVRLDGKAIQRSPRPRPLLSVPIDVPNATRAEVQILTAGAPSTIELHERGVRLQHLMWTPLAGLPSQSADYSLSIPARVVVDSDILATNASRSSLREDSDMMRALPAATSDGFRKALNALAHLVTGEGKLPSGVIRLPAEPIELENALGAIACVVANADDASDGAREARFLLDLPLLHAADGGRLALSSVRGERHLYAYSDKKPLSSRLTPWFSRVIWLRGRSIESALTGISLLDARGLIDVATRGAERREAHLSHPASAPTVPSIPNELAREKFRYRRGPLAGLEGELVLVVPRTNQERVALFRFYVEERLLETLPLDPSYVPLSFDVALAWPGYLRPRMTYDCVERDRGMAHAMNAVAQIAIGLANRVATQMPKLTSEERTALEPILERAILSFATVPERLGLVARSGFSLKYPALYSANVFSTTDGKRVSLQHFANFAHHTGALCAVRAFRHDASWAAPDGRPVLLARADDARALAGALGSHVVVVPYERGVEGAKASESERRAAVLDAVQRARVSQGLPGPGPVSFFTQGSALGAVAPAHSAVCIDLHAGVRLGERKPNAAAVPVIVALDDPNVVPTPNWDGTLHRVHHSQLEEIRLCERLVQALEGDPSATGELGTDWDVLHPSLAVFLLSFAVFLRRDPHHRRRAAGLLERLEAVPILEMLDEAGAPKRVSITEVTTTHGPTPPILDRAPGFWTFDLHPIIVRSPAERAALLQRFVNAKTPDDAELGERAARATQARARRELIGQPQLDPTDLTDLAEVGEIRVDVADPVTGISVVAALPKQGPSPAAGRVRVLFQGRRLAFAIDAPFAAVVNLTRDEDLVDFRGLSTDGAARAQDALKDAGVRLAEAVVDAASGMGNAGRFLSDPRAIELYAWLGARMATLALEPKLFGDSFYWPTVQGDSRLSDDFWRLGEIWYGTSRYAEWKRREGVETDLDRPVMYLPPVHASSVLLDAFRRRGLTPRDVTAALANLQVERGIPQAPPILTGMPAHPALRTSLRRLGIQIGDGELELVPGPGSEVCVQLLGGIASMNAPVLTCPVRVVIRVESLDAASATTAVLEQLDGAIERFVLELVPSLDALPTFVRQNARRLACAQVGKRASGLSRVPLFVDTTGARVSLQEMAKHTDAPWAFTTLEPPFPGLKRRCVLMTRDEAKQIKPLVSLRLADPAITRARQVMSRRNAPQLAYIGLTDLERGACIATRKISTETLTGEVGVLAPHCSLQRGISVHVTRRPLCRIEDQPGFPLIAVVNDDSVKPDRAFERIAHTKRAARLADSVREIARQMLQDAFTTPGDAIGSEWVDGVECGGFRITGRFWVPSQPSRVAPVMIDSSLTPEASLRPLHVDPPARGILPIVPVEGRLLAIAEGVTSVKTPADATSVAVDRALGALSEFAGLAKGLGQLGRDVAARIITAARLAGPTTPALDEYTTHLALLGAKISALPFSTTEGKQVAIPDILVELQRRGVIWTSDGSGFVEGEFPSVPPAFILSDDGSARMRALAQRLDPRALKHVGSSAALTSHPEIAVRETSVSEVEESPANPSEPQAPFWRSLGERVSSLFKQEEPAREASPLVVSLLALLEELKLAGNPIESVVDAPKGRPIRYDRRRRRLLLCATHPVVAKLSTQPRGLESLAAAAVCEVNRALVDVTDAEERRALLALLEQV